MRPVWKARPGLVVTHQVALERFLCRRALGQLYLKWGWGRRKNQWHRCCWPASLALRPGLRLGQSCPPAKSASQARRTILVRKCLATMTGFRVLGFLAFAEMLKKELPSHHQPTDGNYYTHRIFLKAACQTWHPRLRSDG